MEADVDRLARQEQRRIDLTDQAHAGHGPQMSALRARRQELERAATAEAALPKARATAQQADRHLSQVHARVRALEEQSGHGRLRLRMQGTSQEEVSAQLKQAQAQRGAARAAREKAHDQVTVLTTTASLLYGAAPGRPAWREGDATAAHRQVIAGWERWRAQAVADDVRTVPERARIDAPKPSRAQVASMGFNRAPRRPAADLAQARQELTVVRGEIALRTLLPADVATAEKTRRAAAQSQAPVVGRSPGQHPRRTSPPRPDRGPGGRSR